jgi:hypothetical protein
MLEPPRFDGLRNAELGGLGTAGAFLDRLMAGRKPIEEQNA